MEADQSFVGLGFHSAPLQSGATVVAEGDDLGLSANELVKNYLQQCLAYHDEQEGVRHRDETEFRVASTEDVPIDEPPRSASTGVGDETMMEGPAGAPVSTQSQQQVEEGRLRAQAILKRFEEQQQQFLGGMMVSGADLTDVEPVVYRRQRELGFQREAERKKLAILKNFEYLTHRASCRVGELAAQIDESRELEIMVNERYQIALEERKRLREQRTHNLNSQAAIGTEKRKHMDKQVRKAMSARDIRVSLYLTGLPTNESVGEDFVRNLFGSYGQIRKVHLYRDKASGEMKGDGLVVYNLASDGSEQELVEVVCSQVSASALRSIRG